MKLLDTTFLIDLLNGKKETFKIIQQNEEFLTTQINMYEVIRGLFFRGAKKAEIQKSIELFENIRVLKLNDKGIVKSAEIFANLAKNGKMISDSDCLTAGIALSYDVDQILTKNTKHFKRIKGIKVINY